MYDNQKSQIILRTMFHEVLCFLENEPMKGKVFSIELDRKGLARSNRTMRADIAEWDDCLECEERVEVSAHR